MKRTWNIEKGRGLALVKYNETNPQRSFVVGLGTPGFMRRLRERYL